MLQDTPKFELLFSGVEHNDSQNRSMLSELLENTCGLQLIELEATLGNTSQGISILRAAASNQLAAASENLRHAGAKVLIVRSSEFTGPKIFSNKS